MSEKLSEAIKYCKKYMGYKRNSPYFNAFSLVITEAGKVPLLERQLAAAVEGLEAMAVYEMQAEYTLTRIKEMQP